ncbi:MAG: 1-acyl-sn-glycerol-3-phosphate acyltransferase [Bacteroidetes bacterium]|nr:1-acyl-sn-glycerol-3-phosphate acyltransferase [Bacteroidota bacterium]
MKYINEEVLRINKQYIIVANHNSHIDTVAILSVVPFKKLKSVHPVAAGDYFGSSPVKAFFTKAFVNAILIPRKRAEKPGDPDPIEIMQGVLAKGESIIIFPEGSRGEPEKFQKFKKGIGLLLKDFPDVPFIPVYMQGLGKSLPKGDTVLVPHDSTILFGRPHFVKSQNVDEIVLQIEEAIKSMEPKLN